MAHFWPLCVVDGSDMHEKKNTATQISDTSGYTCRLHNNKNIARVRNCPDVAILNSPFGLCLLSFCLFVFLSFCLFVPLFFCVSVCLCFCLFCLDIINHAVIMFVIEYWREAPGELNQQMEELRGSLIYFAKWHHQCSINAASERNLSDH